MPKIDPTEGRGLRRETVIPFISSSRVPRRHWQANSASRPTRYALGATGERSDGKYAAYGRTPGPSRLGNEQKLFGVQETSGHTICVVTAALR
jgi:hypothetical protein